MKVLMLGWEYPPHIAGGLGRACEGLSTSLAGRGVSIHFVVPHLFGGEKAEHMTLMDSRDSTRVLTNVWSTNPLEMPTRTKIRQPSESISTVRVPAFLSPYWSPERFRQEIVKRNVPTVRSSRRNLRTDEFVRALVEGEVYGVDLSALFVEELNLPLNNGVHYGNDIFEEVERFTANVVSLMANEKFDVIHAHDWMTFPAGVALSEITGRPLVVHIHSLEYDRSGIFVNDQINEIERFGVRCADRVIAVSYFTQRAIERHHAVSRDKIFVVHNGVYPKEAVDTYRVTKTWPRHVVLFLGRVTFQKGPDYFVEVATRVVPHVPDVLFVLAGSGDMLDSLKQRVKELNLADHFLFPGFLKGEEVEEMFSVADLYVMPSVSEPFGLSALEAINFNTPVIISKQSGVAEVLDHALKADFWDIDRLADLIINGLLHDELREDLVTMAKEEVRKLHWDAAANKTIEVYQSVAG